MAQYLQSRIEVPVWLEPNDISFLRTRISEAETLVQTFESRMDELRAQISELSRQKDAKLVEIASLRNVLAPVRRLPLEILSEIFELVSEYRPWYIVSHMFMLSSVCVAWRKTAHAAPPLWSTLRIDMEAHILGSGYTWVNDWFTRSQMVPLNLHLGFYMEEYDESLIQRGKKFLEYILTQLGHKVRLLDVVGYPSSFLPILHLSPSFSLLSLEEMSLTIYEDEDDTIAALVDLFPRKFDVLLGAPKLRQVKLNTASLLKLLALPAEKLTSLSVKADDELEFDPVMFVDILLRCKQLVNLEIYRPSDFIGSSTRLSILLPTLRSFEVTCHNAADNILHCITTPLLERLSIRYYDQDFDSLVMDVSRFQQCSSTALSSLVFSLRPSTNSRCDLTEKAIAVFSLFPTIRSLEIHPPFDVNSLMQAMTCIEGHHVLPDLQALVLDGYPNYYRTRKDYRLSCSGFKSMVLSRWWPDSGGSASFRNGLSRLQKVTLRGFRVDSVEDITPLSALSGLVFDYTAIKEC